MKLEDYQKALQTLDLFRDTCFCGAPIDREAEIQHYDNSAGFPVDGFPKLQWLYIVCPTCEHQWALNKILPRDWIQQIYEQQLGS